MKKQIVLFAGGTLLLCAAALASGCAMTKEIKAGEYQESARRNFEAGMAEFLDGDLEDATFYFNIVLTKYSVSKYATLAELRQADIDFLNDNYVEASQAYARFSKNHPSHPCGAYAVYRTGVSYLMQVPEDWWFMPPAAERDQQITEQAYDTLRRFLIMVKALDTVPEQVKGEVSESDAMSAGAEVGYCLGDDAGLLSRMIVDAHLRLKWCAMRLIDREMYVAKFYFSNDKPKGAIFRLTNLMADRRFQERGLDRVPEVLYLLIEAYVEDERPLESCPYVNELVDKHPDAEQTEDLKDDYASLVEICKQKKAEAAEKKSEGDEKAAAPPEEKPAQEPNDEEAPSALPPPPKKGGEGLQLNPYQKESE